MPIRLGFVPVVRPLFRGARLGLWETSRRALEAMGPALGCALAYAAPPVADAAEAEARAREAAAADLDLVLVHHVTFATGDVLRPLLGLDAPLGLWALPEATISGPLPQNALCGLNLALSLPTRRRLPAKWFYGAADAPGFRDALAQTVHALRGRRALVGGRVLWIGGAAPGFDRLESVPDLPLEIHRAGLETLFAAIEAVDPADAAARLGASDEPADGQAGALLATMRLELALERLASGFDGVALRCWPELPDRAGTMACAALARLADRGLPMACEGDAAGLAAMLAASAVTGGPAVLLDLSRAERDALLFWHCGNAPRALAAGATRLAAHFNRGLPAVREMRLAPGPVCGLRFLEDHAAVVYGGRLVDRADGYDGVCGWIGGLRWAGRPVDPAGFLASVLNLRLPHHFVWAAGDHERALLELCQWMDLRVLDPDPTPRLVRWPA